MRSQFFRVSVQKELIFFLSILLPVISESLFDDLKEKISKPVTEVLFSNKCIEDLGCFYTGPPFFHSRRRPISLPPSDLQDTKTKFWLFTPKQKTKKYLLQWTAQSLQSSTFDSSLPTKFLVHGFFVQFKESNTLYRMKDTLLEEGHYNVIFVDWTDSNGSPYVQAVSNARLVGAQVAKMIKFLEENGVKPGSVHLIGHSLGCHVAGYAGKRITGLGRITALDPAGPYFSETEKEVRLDASDADLVDVIHTNAGTLAIDGLGITDPIGDIDFYPNGGKHQPFCKPVLLNVSFAGINVTVVANGEGLTALLALICDHSAAIEYFTASILPTNCTFTATECESYEKFLNGDCDSNRKVAMGFKAEKLTHLKPGYKFYLSTSEHFPYCIA